MKLKLTKNGLQYRSFVFGFWEYAAIILLIIVWMMVIFMPVRICQ